MNLNPVQAVFEQCQYTPDALALYADGIELTYGELLQQVLRLSDALRSNNIGHKNRVGILASRSLIAIQAVFSVAWCGATYVPLGTRWPEERIKTVNDLTRLDAIVVDQRAVSLISPEVLSDIKLVVVPDQEVASLLPDLPTQVILALESLPGPGEIMAPAKMSGDDLAYIIFTSGTTGVPKGVMVNCASVDVYLRALGGLKAMTPEDRASQFTELSFDPSLGEIFVPLTVGASLHVVPPLNSMSPVRFIRERQLSVWGSTPAAIAWMRDTRALQPGVLSCLRYSSFGGEPLPLESVLTWQAAAPNSAIDNFYGPTEATVDCAAQRVDAGAAPVVSPDRGILAIGVPHPGSELAIFDQDRHRMPAGEIGELAIAGGQLAVGYLDAPDLTARRYPTIDGKRWFLTGDLAYQDESGLFHYMGRQDNQIKIHGYRVELEDVEAHLRAVVGDNQVVAVAWPIADGVAKGIVGFVANSSINTNQVREALRNRLPAYMVPSRIHALEELPHTASGKVDRNALIVQLDSAKGKGS